MAKRSKIIIGQFAMSSVQSNIEEVESYLNTQYQYNGALLETETAAELAQNATNTTVVAADPGLNTGRKVRFVKDTDEELDLITALALTVTVTRGDREAHALAASVLDAAGDQVGVLSAAMGIGAAVTTFTMTAVEKAFAVAANLTIDDETLIVTGLSSQITFARPTGNTAIAAPFEIRDDNGPYTIEDMLEISEKLAVVMVDGN